MPAVRGSHARLSAHLHEELRRRFSDAGWSVEAEPIGGPPGYRPDLLVTHGKARYVVEMRVAMASRRREAVGLLADAWLRASAGARAHRARPLAVLGARAISHALAQELENYARSFLPGGAWGFIEPGGQIVLKGPGLEGLCREGGETPARPTVGTSWDPFSDLGQWLLKVLLAPSLPTVLLDAPRERVSSARQLAALSAVSVPTAARFTSGLRERGFLEVGRTFELVRLEELLEAWKSAARRAQPEARYRWLIGGKDHEQHLRRKLARYAARHTGADGRLPHGRRVCLGLFAACDLLGLGIVRGVASHLYVEDESTVAELGLVPAKEGETAQVLARRPAYPETLFRGCVMRDGIPTADVLQCWIDVAEHPSRGAEQAEHLYRRALALHLGLESS